MNFNDKKHSTTYVLTTFDKIDEDEYENKNSLANKKNIKNQKKFNKNKNNENLKKIFGDLLKENYDQLNSSSNEQIQS